MTIQNACTESKVNIGTVTSRSDNIKTVHVLSSGYTLAWYNAADISGLPFQILMLTSLFPLLKISTCSSQSHAVSITSTNCLFKCLSSRAFPNTIFFLTMSSRQIYLKWPHFKN